MKRKLEDIFLVIFKWCGIGTVGFLFLAILFVKCFHAFLGWSLPRTNYLVSIGLFCFAITMLALGLAHITGLITYLPQFKRVNGMVAYIANIVIYVSLGTIGLWGCVVLIFAGLAYWTK
jgi:cytochrome b561